MASPLWVAKVEGKAMRVVTQAVAARRPADATAVEGDSVACPLPASGELPVRDGMEYLAPPVHRDEEARWDRLVMILKLDLTEQPASMADREPEVVRSQTSAAS